MEVSLELKKKILNILRKSDLDLEAEHAENTFEWVLKLKPDASVALQIAALGHDLERGRENRFKSEDFEDHAEYKKAHSEEGARILRKLLEKHNLNKETIDEACRLVELHEVGGTEDADILRDADSISFFDNNLEFYIKYKGIDGAKKQVQYKFERCSPRARKYIQDLDSYKKFVN